jgi:hypothetical protein
MDTFNECKANLSQKPAIFLKNNICRLLAQICDIGADFDCKTAKK